MPSIIDLLKQKAPQTYTDGYGTTRQVYEAPGVAPARKLYHKIGDFLNGKEVQLEDENGETVLVRPVGEIGIAGFLGPQSVATATKGAVAATEIARALNKNIKTAKIADSPVTQNILAGKIGGAPKQSKVLGHNSETPISKLETMFPAGDTVERGAPLGHVGGTGTETRQGFIGARPFHLRSAKPVEMNKPMVQLNESVGNGKNAVRNEILQFADQSGADAINFSNIKDNTLSNQDVYAIFKDVDVKPKLTTAEITGIPKGERSNPKALEDPYYWGYKQGNDRYNAAIDSGTVEDVEKLIQLQYKRKAPDSKIINDDGSIKKVYTFVKPYNRDWIVKQPWLDDPGFFTSSSKGESIYYPMDATKDMLRRAAYLNIKRPAVEVNRTLDGNNVEKRLVPVTTASDSQMKIGGSKQYTLGDAGSKEKNPIISGQLQKEGSDTIKKLNAARGKGFNMYEGEIFNIHGPKMRELSDKYKIDGIVHNVGGTTHYLTFDPKQIKSANLITYNDAGEMIPIVKRFQFSGKNALDKRYKQGGILKGQK